jgi:HemY protein
MQATRLGQQPQEALKTARMLAKHQGFSKVAAQGLLRSLAAETLATAHDIDQLRRLYLQFDSADRRDPVVAAGAARRAAELGAPEDGRGWLRPFWDRLDELTVDERAAVAQGLVAALDGIGPDWLARLEAAARAYPREAAIAHAVGSALAERRLWGKARQLLESAAADAALEPDQRRRAWLTMARMAEEEGHEERAVECFEAAARLG